MIVCLDNRSIKNLIYFFGEWIRRFHGAVDRIFKSATTQDRLFSLRRQTRIRLALSFFDRGKWWSTSSGWLTWLARLRRFALRSVSRSRTTGGSRRSVIISRVGNLPQWAGLG